MANQEPGQAGHTVGNGQEVVFLDDDRGDLVLARHCYARCGVTNPLVAFSDPSEFIAFCRSKEARGDPPPAVLFLDINMPGMDGFDVLSWLKQSEYFEHVPVVCMLTNSRNPDDVARAMRLGADGYFVKPAGIEEFVEILCGALGD